MLYAVFESVGVKCKQEMHDTTQIRIIRKFLHVKCASSSTREFNFSFFSFDSVPTAHFRNLQVKFRLNNTRDGEFY